MILRAALAASILLSTSAAFADAHFDRTLQVSGQPDLYVSSNSGSIHISPGSDSQIHVSAHLHPGWNKGGDVEDRMNRIAANPPIEQSGNTIKIGDARPEDRELFNNISIDYEVTAPPSRSPQPPHRLRRHQRRRSRPLHQGRNRLRLSPRPRHLRPRGPPHRLRRHRAPGTLLR